MNIIEELKWRGLIYQSTDIERLQQRLEQGSITLYCGFDPTADSLHIGHLLPILTLRHFQLHGHRPIALVGGATGLIGDPSGKKAERTLNPATTVKDWAQRLQNQLAQFLDFENADNSARMANNYDWLHQLSIVDFLRNVGKNFPVNYMLSKETVSSRLEKGISFTEFSYMILQSYDFLNLHQQYGCELQIGGSDQWGNMTAGVELIRRTSDEQAEVHVMTVPLVTKSDGQKFGKTEGGAIWLDPKKTSPYQFYQFWMNTHDQDVVQFLKYFTFLHRGEIEALQEQVEAAPEKREAQRRLAEEMTQLVHGSEAVLRAQRITEALFHGDLRSLTVQEIQECFSDVPSTHISDQEQGIVEALLQVGAAQSKREAREFLSNGAIRINDEKHQQTNTLLKELNPIAGKYLVIRRGKKKYYLIELS